jgi:hypothetical protein
MPTTPAAFAKIELNTFDESACSPEVDEGLRGIRLAAPAQISLTEGAPLPLCGTYQVGARFFNRFQCMENEIVVVAVDAERHTPYATNLLQPDFDPVPAPGFDEQDPGFDEIVLAGWFNLDLFHWLEDLPRRPARYHVFATVGDIASNVVTVELVKP